MTYFIVILQINKYEILLYTHLNLMIITFSRNWYSIVKKNVCNQELLSFVIFLEEGGAGRIYHLLRVQDQENCRILQ